MKPTSFRCEEPLDQVRRKLRGILLSVSKIGIALAVFSVLVSCRVAAGGTPPQIRNVRAENYFFGAARPGDRYVITLEAEREDGISQLNASILRSRYEGGKNEPMIGVAFKPTGKPNEFRAEFIVPSHRSDNREEPLPRGSYRVSLRSGVSADGGAYAHDYEVIHGVQFDPEPGPPFEVKFKGSTIVHGPEPPRIDFDIATRGEDRTVDYEVTVLDYFGQPIGKPLRGAYDLKQYQRSEYSLTLPRAEDAEQYRLALELADRKSDYTVRERRRLLTERTSGPRRELILDDAAFQHLPLSEVSDRPPPDDADWKPGPRSWGGRWRNRTLRWTDHFDPDTVVVWLRHEFEAPEWLAGDPSTWLGTRRCELYFGELSYLVVFYLNGRPLNEPVGGVHTPLWVDATAAFRPGERNVLHVRMEDAGATENKTVPGPAADMSLPYYGETTWPHSMAWGGLGLRQEVRVRTYPAASLKDVFAMSSVTDEELGLRTEVRNTGNGTRKLKLVHQVIDSAGGGKTVLRFKPETVKLGAGEIRRVDQAKDWADPILWSFGRGYLYRLQSQLLDERGRVIDEVDSRFGFREFRVDGRHFLFNGNRFKAVLSSTLVEGDYEGAHEFLANYLKARGGAGSYLRMHWVMPGRPYLDVADELGVLLEPECPMGSVINDYSRQETWDNFANIAERLHYRDKNRPSVVVLSLCNELLHCNSMFPTTYDINQRGLLRVANLLTELNPTRPLVVNGDGAIDGSWNTMNLHYARYWHVRPDLPNSAFWLKYGDRGLPCDVTWPIQIDWDEPKVVMFGEDSLFGSATYPHDFSSLGGDEVYRVTYEKGRNGEGPGTCHDIDDRGHAMLIEGYRDAEVSITTTALGGGGGPECGRAHLPVRSFVRERSSRFYSGKIIERNINLHHDMLEAAPVEFSWSLKQGDKVFESSDKKYRMEPAELRRLVVNLQMPVVRRATPVTFTTTVMRRGKEMFSQTHDYTVYPPLKLEVPEGIRLGMLDRSRRTASFFEEQNIPFLTLGSIDSYVDKDVMRLNCLLIGEEGMDGARLPRMRGTLMPYLKKGGVIVCLRQEWGQEWLSSARPLAMDPSRETTISWRRRPDHPVLAGITDDMLRYWYGDNIVSTWDFLKEPRVGWQPIVDSGGPRGLRWTSVMEMPVEKGAIVFCQMNLMDKIRNEPAAARIMENLLSYGVSREPVEPRRIAAIAARETPVFARLHSTGVKFSREADAEVVVVDAQAEMDEASVGALAEGVRGGQTVLLHGLTPDNLSRWRGLLPGEVELEKTERKHAARAGDHPLLAGMSGTELWWEEPREYGVRGVAIAYSAKANGVGTELIREGGLIDVPLGDGHVLIDQLLWERQDVHQDRSARYLSLLLHNLAYADME